jgi:TolB-like protein/Tfp pilus assembly protein PilF
MAGSTFFSELRKRKVVQAAAIYGAVAWGVTEILVTIVEQLFLPQWVSTLAVIGFVVGFPVAMFLAWTFDITPDGIRRTDVTSGRGKASIALAMLLLVAGTAGLFFLIRPAIELGARGEPALAIAPDSVAVLPFENASADPNDSYLSEGLSDELRDQLGRVAGLRIAARSSSVAARELGADAMASAARLGVANLVEGSLRRRGNTLRVSVQLIEGSSGLAVWSETYERGPNELLTVQQEIAEQIVRRVLPDAAEVVTAPATRNVNANELMLLARHYEQSVRARESVDEETLLKAITLYRQAAEADPQSALAHSRLAGALLWLGDLAAAEAPIFRALSLDPGLSEVQHTLGLYYYARGLPEARTAFQRAVELNPNNADALSDHAHSFYVEGVADGVEELYRHALELDPLSLERYGALGQFLGTQGSREEILELARLVEVRFEGADSLLLIARLQELVGHVDQAIAWTLRARELDPDKSGYADRLAELYADIGDFDTALRLAPEPGVGVLFKMRRYRELIDQAELLVIDEPEDLDVRYLLAFAHQAVGQFDPALWVLSPTGLPDSVMGNARRTADWEGFFTLINAAWGAGDAEVAQGLAQWFVDDPTHFGGVDWWPHTYMACALSVIGRHAEALERIERIRGSHRFPWDPVLRDSFCFQGLQNHPVYQETLAVFDQRRGAMRARLPTTLTEFGVAL